MSSRLKVLLRYCVIYTRMAVLILMRRPYKLTLLVSDSCNLRCQICSIWKHPSQFLTFDEVVQLWSAFKLKPCWINISGGEPALNTELPRILEYFATMPRSLLITLTTNGYVDLVPMVTHVLQTNRRSVLFVSVSMDGEEVVHDVARGRPGSYARAHRSLQGLLALSSVSAALTVGISVTLSRVNLGRVLPFVAQRMRQMPVSVNLAQSSDYYGNTDSDGFDRLPSADLVEILRAIQHLQPKLSLASLLKVNFLESAIRHLDGTYKPIACSSIIDNVLVTADLNLVDCSLHFRRWVPLGVGRDERLRWVTDAIRFPSTRHHRLRQRLLRERCELTCHTPCEAYVHLTSALLRPRHAPRLIATFLLRSVESRIFGKQLARRLECLTHKLKPTERMGLASLSIDAKQP